MLTTLALFSAALSHEWLYEEMYVPMAESAIEDTPELEMRRRQISDVVKEEIKKMDEELWDSVETADGGWSDPEVKRRAKIIERKIRGWLTDKNNNVDAIIAAIENEFSFKMQDGSADAKVKDALMKLDEMVKKMLSNLPTRINMMMMAQDVALDKLDGGDLHASDDDLEPMDSVDMDPMDSTTLDMDPMVLASTECLNAQQKRQLQNALASTKTTLSLSAMSLNMAAIFSSGQVKEHLQKAATIISSVNNQLVAKLQPIVTSTCGSCSQISTSVSSIVTDLKNTLSASVPEWQTDKLFNTVTTVVQTITTIVPSFCPPTEQPQMDVMMDTMQSGDDSSKGTDFDMDHMNMGVLDAVATKPCLDDQQKHSLKVSMVSIKTVLSVTVTTLNVAAMFKDGQIKQDLQESAKIIGAVNSQLVAKLEPIVESTCGSCKQISTQVAALTKTITNTLDASVPEWKTNPIYASVTQVVNMMVSLVPNFCPQPKTNANMMATAMDADAMDDVDADAMAVEEASQGLRARHRNPMTRRHRKKSKRSKRKRSKRKGGKSGKRSKKCLTSKQKRNMAATITAIQSTLTVAHTGLSLAAAYNIGAARRHLQIAARAINAVNSELVTKIDPIVKSSCGSCARIASGFHQIIARLTSTLSKAAPDWKTNPLFATVVTIVHSLSAIAPKFCPHQG